jgi:hypothetical protein
MKIYVVIKHYNPECYELLKAFYNIEKANKFIEENKDDNYPSNYALFIEEINIDEE